MSQEKLQTMIIQNFWGVKEVYYGIVQVENLIGRHFWRQPLQGNDSETVTGLFEEINVCRFAAVAWGRGVLSDFPRRVAAMETIKNPEVMNFY